MMMMMGCQEENGVGVCVLGGDDYRARSTNPKQG